MKKKYHSITKKIAPVKLFLDEIEKITEILQEEKFSDIKIDTIDNQYEHNELKDIKPTETITAISASTPIYISITFEQSYGEGVRLYAATNTALAHGVIEKIETVMLPRVRKFFTQFSKGITALAFFIAAMSAPYLFDDTLIRILSGVLFLILYLFSITLKTGKLVRINIIHLKKRQEQQNFWQINRDKILVGIVVGIIVAIFSSYLGYLVGQE